MKLLWKHMHNNRYRFVLALGIGVIYTFICVVVPTISGELINGFIGGPSYGVSILFIYLICSALQIIFFLLDQKASKYFDAHQKRIMRRNVFRTISRKDYIKKEKIAFYSSFINNDIPTASSQFFLGTIDIIKCVSLICFSALSLINVHFILGFIVIILSVSIVCIPNLIRKKSGAARKVYSEKMSAYNAQLQSYLGGIKVIASFRYHNRANSLIEQHNSEVTSSEIILGNHQRFVQGVTAFLQTLKTVLILVIGVILIAEKQINIGDLVVILELDSVIGAPIEFLSYIIHGRNEAIPLVKEYSNIVEDQEDGYDSTATIETVEVLRLRDIEYHVGEVKILQGVSFEFEKLKKYIITGPSGSGKSTLLNVLSGMEKVTSGSIFVNTSNVYTSNKAAYREKVCVVFQEPYLFETTLEENILLGRDIPRWKYRSVIERLNLTYLLERYADCTISPELADTLSGGEKQRVCLARAMVGQPEFYLLDEVTSALDKDTARAIETAILSENATIIHVCHKPTPELYEQYDVHLQLYQGKLQVVSRH